MAVRAARLGRKQPPTEWFSERPAALAGETIDAETVE
ncbi:hypothetical protein SAMN05216360_10591 [Methylobacterium phyllostachyos]|uniref:Uncharacterized protein n=1 Tax=Methylobacterium phyllostachyos TaxID=582672 RepID=A0A1G9XYK9_9HYPH|nr:hypothetical protein SAMN05216360_10591 [Methylobacterium phyllostachyos]